MADLWLTTSEAATFTGLTEDQLKLRFFRGLSRTKKVDGVLVWNVLDLKPAPGNELGSEDRAVLQWAEQGFEVDTDGNLLGRLPGHTAADAAPRASGWTHVGGGWYAHPDHTRRRRRADIDEESV